MLPARNRRHRARPDRLARQPHLRRRAAALPVATTYGIQPYGGHPAGWTSPWVLGSATATSAAAAIW